MDDLISRQDAIAELNESAEMKRAILDSLDISDRRARDMIEAELGQINGDIDSIKNMPSAQPELIEQGAYVRGFEQGRTQGRIDAQGAIMKVKELIKELEKLPQDIEIAFEDYNHRYLAEICWNITMEEYEEGYSDEPYIWLTKQFEK